MGVIFVGGGKHCNNCGHEWDNKIKVERGPTRRDMENGWKQPKLKEIARGFRGR